MDLIDIGEALREARKSAGLSQSELAELADTGRARIDAIENGRAPEVGVKFLLRLMNAVGLDLRMTTFNAGRPTLDDLQAENQEDSHAPRMGR